MSEATDFDRQIHERLLAGSLTASVELAEAYLELLVRGLRRRFPVREVPDETLLRDAATDALLDYVERPEQYDPDRLALLPYLTMAAYGDALNALQKESRRTRRLISLDAALDPVEEAGHGGNEILRALAVEDTIAYDGDEERVRELMERVRAAVPDERDRRLLALLLDGVRETPPYAAILGVEHLPREEQQATVKRNKDRLKKVLTRLGVKLRERTRS